jgi:hypothetical protein
MKMIVLVIVLFAIGLSAQERKIASPETQKERELTSPETLKRGFSAGDEPLNPSMVARRQAALARRLTVDICRTDLSNWGNQAEWDDYFRQQADHQNDDETKNTNRFEQISVEESAWRYNELMSCGFTLDGVNKTKYLDIASHYDDIETARMYSFMVRHNLWRQFKTEDEAGIRGHGF